MHQRLFIYFVINSSNNNNTKVTLVDEIDRAMNFVIDSFFRIFSCAADC